MTTSHDDLREALERRLKRHGEMYGCIECYGGKGRCTDRLVLEAARCWLDLTSDGNVEIAAKALESEAKKNPVESSYMPGMSSRIMSQPIEDVARAVLEAVRSNHEG